MSSFQNQNRFWTFPIAEMNHQKLNLRSKCETLLVIFTELSYVFFDFSKNSSYLSCKIEIKWKFFHIKSWKVVLFCPILLPDFVLIVPKLQSGLSQLVDVLEGRATQQNARTRELLNFRRSIWHLCLLGRIWVWAEVSGYVWDLGQFVGNQWQLEWYH